jgi:hypothetical protein
MGIHGLVSSYSEGFSFKFLAVLVSMYCSIVARWHVDFNFVTLHGPFAWRVCKSVIRDWQLTLKLPNPRTS